MSFNSTPVHAPWAYDSLPNQETVESEYVFQIMQGLVLGGYIWDIVISGVKDYEFVFFRRFNYVTCLYITNRLSATICIIGYFILNHATTVDCTGINKMTAISEGLCQLTSSALLSLRIWVLYSKQIYVPIFMTAFLFPGPIIDIIVWAPLRLMNLPSPGGCGFASYPPSWEYVPFLLQSIFDLLVFLLCLVKLLWSTDLSIRHLGNQPIGLTMRVRREFLNGGFVYYIPNVAIQIINLVFITHPFSWGAYATASASDLIASAQALRITRNLWKASSSQNPDESHMLQTSNDRDQKKATRSRSEIETPRLVPGKEGEQIVCGVLASQVSNALVRGIFRYDKEEKDRFRSSKTKWNLLLPTTCG